MTGKIIEKNVNDLQEEYFENGKLNWKTNYEEGKLDGTSEIYYKNGQLKEESNWVNGIKDGLFKNIYWNFCTTCC